MSKSPSSYNRFVFLDRDGVINVERGDYTTSIKEWEWAPGSLEGLKIFSDTGFGVIIITNQACIAKGRQTEGGLARLHSFMLRHIRESGGDILKIYHCPHLTSDCCSCRHYFLRQGRTPKANGYSSRDPESQSSTTRGTRVNCRGSLIWWSLRGVDSRNWPTQLFSSQSTSLRPRRAWSSSELPAACCRIGARLWRFRISG